MSVRFALAHAAAQGTEAADWEPLAARCVRDLGDAATAANLGFVYVTDALAGRLDEVVAFLRHSTGVSDWVGSVGIGIIAATAEFFDRPAMAVMVASLPRDAFRLLPNVTAAGDEGKVLRDWATGHAPTVAVVHADPRNPQLSQLIAGLAADLQAFLVGGLTSSRGAMDQVAGRVTSGGVSGVLFGDGVTLATGLTQGCSPIGPQRTVTGAERNVIHALDGRPALDALKADLGDPARAGGDIHVALPVGGSDTGDYLVRNLIGVDPKRGSIAVGDIVAVGDALMFCRRDRAAAAEDLARMIGRLKRRLDKPPQAGLFFNCIARGPNLFGDGAEELAIVRRELGEFPLIGMFCNGEISNNRLYGYTGVLALFV